MAHASCPLAADTHPHTEKRPAGAPEAASPAAETKRRDTKSTPPDVKAARRAGGFDASSSEEDDSEEEVLPFTHPASLTPLPHMWWVDPQRPDEAVGRAHL